MEGEQVINKITISTQITQQSTPSETPISDWCSDFSDIFSEQTHIKLPPHCHYDHTIDLQPTFTSHIAKIYPLNPAELQTCKEFIDKHLKTEQIVPFKSPQASPFFFVPKKDGSLCLCQDYWYLNSHTVQNMYPLPLIPELIDNMKDATLFTKFDIRWGYNNIHICKEDQWKATFITPLGLFKPTVMFFRFCNAPSTFQAFMMLCEYHRWSRKESKESFKVGHRLVEIIKSLTSSGVTRWTKGKGGLGLEASDSRQKRCDVYIVQIKSTE